jgi:hypothetical protein
MAILTTRKSERITLKRFPRIHELLELPPIERPGSDVPTSGGITLSEGCLITKGVKYTHDLTRWVNVTRGDAAVIVRKFSLVSLAVFDPIIAGIFNF